jgi:hypothetical protein
MILVKEELFTRRKIGLGPLDPLVDQLQNVMVTTEKTRAQFERAAKLDS